MAETKSTADRFARWRERRAHRRVLRAQRRGRTKGDFADAARSAEGDVYGKARFR